MTAQWADAKAYLRKGDPLHQGPAIAGTTLNIYLNLLAAAQRRQKAAQRPAVIAYGEAATAPGKAAAGKLRL